MPRIDFDRLRAEISLPEVLRLIGFERRIVRPHRKNIPPCRRRFAAKSIMRFSLTLRTRLPKRSTRMRCVS
jgi:hypothetical protein